MLNFCQVLIIESELSNTTSHSRKQNVPVVAGLLVVAGTVVVGATVVVTTVISQRRGSN